MADRDIRRLERQVAAGDVRAAARLARMCAREGHATHVPTADEELSHRGAEARSEAPPGVLSAWPAASTARQPFPSLGRVWWLTRRLPLRESLAVASAHSYHDSGIGLPLDAQDAEEAIMSAEALASLASPGLPRVIWEAWYPGVWVAGAGRSWVVLEELSAGTARVLIGEVDRRGRRDWDRPPGQAAARRAHRLREWFEFDRCREDDERASELEEIEEDLTWR